LIYEIVPHTFISTFRSAAVPELWTLGGVAMNTKDIRPRWALAMVVGVIPVIGVICAVVYHNISVFFWSLAVAAVVAVVLPLFLFITFVLSSNAAAAFAGLFIAIQQLFRRR
jgi:hypothetical protein